ncbi:ras guanine nucleotide exchange factor domain-containing protein [Neohortaea acidophila]|uniref:Ras guanine nucleotide exchange factor domain-containing protein n=1 Tax=Neohortaea acidophila TaxID=245834 RepID=A0A6A6Q6J4_9PEZI|nr:ras guanine nucleotide exchange factor domain-containing protein [Neohortaea acidophila]KAF2487017.1 ras guanine nucleotide exchange factor domain-containing protein [Neohortaea acidophila]
MADDQSPDGDDLGVRSFYFDDAVEDDLRHIPFRPPPTPPSTEGGAPNTQSEPRSPTSLFQKSLKETTSVPKLSSNAGHSRAQSNNVDLTRGYTVPSQKHTAHLPFVLAFESDVIAEQLTIIEKDALDEVDWKDLIGLNWQHSPLHLRNWVDFLQRRDCNGIDIVVSRFNLMVKWVVSECVLTEAASERARCITKYIHIAAHAHRLRNYATMYQITLALLSTDLARLHKTWALVQPAEKAALTRLEKLCQPRGNFHQLRMEMEAASADDACIPFIGLYTHDLMFNAQKPARVNPPATGSAVRGAPTEPLVNFERFQTAAGIVKGLLTLIEASAKYVLRPHPEVLSRCLWLAALEDGEILSRSRGLEA